MSTTPSGFQEKEDSDLILNGAIAAVQAVFGTDAPLGVKRALFDTACWLVSERNGKYNLRYATLDSLSSPKNLLRHEHVFPRAGLWFVARRTMSVSQALQLCVSCLVTTEEHEKLHGLKVDAYGWERYAMAGIPVVDCCNGKPIPPERLVEMSQEYKKAFRDARFVGDGEEEIEMIKAEPDFGSET